MPSSSTITESFLAAAEDGDLPYLKKAAEELDNGKGLEDVYLRIRDKLGRAALHYAAYGGRTNVCKYLIRKLKLDVNLKGHDGETPLHCATLKGCLPTATFLIDNGANLASANDKGLTALHYAAQIGHQDYLRLLVSRGAEVDATSESGTPLQCAASRGNKEAVRFLLDEKADPNTVTRHIFTPLIGSILARSLECVTLLLKSGADPNLGSSMVKPLETASAEGEIEMIKILLKAGANPNAVNTDGNTVLEIVALLRNDEAMQILFPVTSHIPTIADWSISGIMSHVHSEEGKKQAESKKKENFRFFKEQGEASFKRKEYLASIYWYTRAIDADPLDARVLANRSLCWVRMNEGEHALADAEASIKLSPNWAKAHYRAGVAYKMLKNYPMATESFSDALKLDPDNKEIRVAFEEAVTEEFGIKVNANLKIVRM